MCYRHSLCLQFFCRLFCSWCIYGGSRFSTCLGGIPGDMNNKLHNIQGQFISPALILIFKNVYFVRFLYIQASSSIHHFGYWVILPRHACWRCCIITCTAFLYSCIVYLLFLCKVYLLGLDPFGHFYVHVNLFSKFVILDNWFSQSLISACALYQFYLDCLISFCSPATLYFMQAVSVGFRYTKAPASGFLMMILPLPNKLWIFARSVRFFYFHQAIL